MSTDTRFGRGVRAGAVALLAVGITAGSVAGQALGGGPFRVPEQNPIYRFFLTPRPERAEILPEDRIEVAWRSTYSNVFEYSVGEGVDSRFDYERWTNTLDLVWAPTRSLELGIRASVMTGFGGVLDPLVQWYHQRLDLPNGDREDVEDNVFAAALAVRGDTVASFDSGTHLADPVVWVGVPLVGGRKALAARLSVKLPVGAEQISSGRAAVALQLDGRHVFARWATYAGVAVGTLGVDGPLEPFTRSAHATLHLGVERRLGDSWSVLAQLQGSSPFLEGVGEPELDRFPVNLGVGFQGTTGSGWRWQAAFTEDVRPNSPGVDMTLDLHLAKVLR